MDVVKERNDFMITQINFNKQNYKIKNTIKIKFTIISLLKVIVLRYQKIIQKKKIKINLKQQH